MCSIESTECFCQLLEPKPPKRRNHHSENDCAALDAYFASVAIRDPELAPGRALALAAATSAATKALALRSLRLLLLLASPAAFGSVAVVTFPME
eukprot:CAMPEP_0185265094 /NCGR_PEP_ID=MMETSP1359-20130426/26347_1 /TAXON_ID=552665 /ORGANISM="Bigelowiella longifila, Strain CCMP242" /LENGTH=94 /DNA_ID=CAMNT_0027854165 /DNA_START=139 /DNA_END=420 /DNA_ORIENTATION=+